MDCEDKEVNRFWCIGRRQWGVERPTEVRTAAFHKQR